MAVCSREQEAEPGLGWNPIQTGDCYLNPSKVLEHRNDGKELYIKCIPMQWPMDNVPGECIFETWTTLDRPVIHMGYRCPNQRRDKTQYRPCPQELPADDNFESKKSLSLKLDPDGKLRTYHLELNSSPEYRGLVTGLAIEPAGSPRPGEELAMQSIELKK